MSHTVKQIEAAIVAALEPLKESPLNVRTVKPLQDELNPEHFARAATLFPAVFVVYATSRDVDHGGRQVEELSFVVFVCDRSFRGDEAQQGSGTNPGAYAMLEAIKDLLWGKELLPNLWPAMRRGQRAFFFDKGVSVYSAEYVIKQAHLVSA